MNEEEKRFKIKKIQKYNEEIDKQENSIINSYSVGLILAAVAVAMYTISNACLHAPLSNPNLQFIGSEIQNITVFPTGISLMNLIKMIQSIGEKTTLKVNLNTLTDELELHGIDVEQELKDLEKEEEEQEKARGRK